MTRTATAPGKIILCGEYAVTFGYPGIAIPAAQHLTVSWEEDSGSRIRIDWPEIEEETAWKDYARKIVQLCEATKRQKGILHIENTIPLQKGMGSSTALVIAIARCLLGEDCETRAKEIEDEVNPGNSGLDFAVIWNAKPLRFSKGAEQEFVHLPTTLSDLLFIDTGKPNETTPELVAWVKERSNEPAIAQALKVIDGCADRLLREEDFSTILHDHHGAQVALGVVPVPVQRFISAIESANGAAKVIGAGAKTGGGGIVLAHHAQEQVLKSLADQFSFNIV